MRLGENASTPLKPAELGCKPRGRYIANKCPVHPRPCVAVPPWL